ncbi:MAG: amino acid-binding protein [Planctomycetes bacterium]|nr:amino acid-binding protein [Planctomycetota bacterium]
MQTRKQLTVFLENKPSRLAQVLSELARNKINIVALSVMDRHEAGVLRLVTEDEAQTTKVVQGLNAPFTESDVLAIELRNQPGALAHLCETLATEHVSIDYAYCSSGGRNGKVFGIFKVSNLEKAQRLLAANNHKRPEKRTLRDQRTYRR